MAMMSNKPKKSNQEDNPERWLVSYADFITLLFAFFAILYATSEIDSEKAKEFQESLEKHLTLLGSNKGVGKTVGQGQQYNSVIEPPIPSFPRTGAKTREALKEVEIYVENELSEKELEERVKDISVAKQGVRISLAADIIFPEGSSRFNRSALETIDKIAEFIKKHPQSLVVESYVGALSRLEESYPTAWDLTSDRATKMVRYLVKIHKIDPERLSAASFGATRKLFPEDSKRNQVRNERLDFVLLTE
jgi:chemotaxis protein MotB